MTAGQLRESVTFQRRAEDANGDRLGDWADSLAVAARVRAMRGTEPVMQARLQGVQPLEITVRSMPKTREIGADWRAVWEGRPYNIRSIAPDETRQFIAIVAEHDQSNG